MTKIWIQEIWPADNPFMPNDGYGRISRGQRKVFEKILHPDTTVHQDYLTRSTIQTTSIFLKLLNDAEIVKGIRKGAKEGYDVAVVNCGNDAGVQPAREVVDIPVVGITEAAMHLACQLGSKFALITVDQKCLPILENNLKLYGLESKAISRKPVRVPEGPEWLPVLYEMGTWYDSVEYTREKVIPQFEKVARECIEDGAEVICTACGGFDCFTLAGYNKVTDTEVPVIDCLVAGLKMAELLGDMRRVLGISTSKHLTYQSLPAEMIDMLAAPFAS